MKYSHKELTTQSESLLAQIHPAVLLESILFISSVRFKTKLFSNAWTSVRFEDEGVVISFPYIASDLSTVRLRSRGDDTLAVTLVKLKDLMCSPSAPQRRLLKIGNWFRHLKTVCEAPPYTDSVTFKVCQLHQSSKHPYPHLSPWPYLVFEMCGIRFTSLTDIVCQNELQWFVWLFNKRYGSSVVSRWEEFCERYLMRQKVFASRTTYGGKHKRKTKGGEE